MLWFRWLGELGSCFKAGQLGEFYTSQARNIPEARGWLPPLLAPLAPCLLLVPVEEMIEVDANLPSLPRGWWDGLLQALRRSCAWLPISSLPAVVFVSLAKRTGKAFPPPVPER